jgi:hypothetical protein
MSLGVGTLWVGELGRSPKIDTPHRSGRMADGLVNIPWRAQALFLPSAAALNAPPAGPRRHLYTSRA